MSGGSIDVAEAAVQHHLRASAPPAIVDFAALALCCVTADRAWCDAQAEMNANASNHSLRQRLLIAEAYHVAGLDSARADLAMIDAVEALGRVAR